MKTAARDIVTWKALTESQSSAINFSRASQAISEDQLTQ
jgi:hypothetical protein